MLTYPASIPLSTRSLTRLTGLIRDHRRALGGRWRRLPAQQQALMALAHLRNSDTLTRLAAGFEVSVATVWRYLREAVDLLAACADDLTAARNHGLIDALTSTNVLTFADKGYQGARGAIWTPFKRRRTRLSRRQKSVNRHHAKIRALGERAVSTLKTWKILTKLRCCPRRATPIVQAILILQAAEDARHPR
ncbi:transposase family protein [Micromonospora chalcea]